MEKTIRYNVGSVSRAVQGEKLLRRNGYCAFVHRRSDAGEGCGYSLWVTVGGETAEQTVERLLRAAGIRAVKSGEDGAE